MARGRLSLPDERPEERCGRTVEGDAALRGHRLGEAGHPGAGVLLEEGPVGRRGRAAGQAGAGRSALGRLGAGGAQGQVLQELALRRHVVQRLVRALGAAQAAPPAVSELAAQAGVDTSVAHRALGALEKAGRIRRVSGELAFDAGAYEALEQAAVALLRAQGGATAAELRDAMGTTRKYAIPLLEHFDAQGVTRRDGDLRMLGPKRA